ncbi:hypothetical protein HanRHA438_Chr14g0668541 [Helianthus annuus]|uniref:Uncharacterized protein n=1 Tax=Helianthus annuus TaxID=4232 RepID=A0A251SJX1_HELAN|nr:uncharacterized protein LOC110904346 [Helianthus annuus]KAF5770273.1 hypothetical protein HanXRQr2_Chr14g0657581 [Helianthus annuus]KAJ0465206.1 hypothetical protein HanHA300_Chr14g0535751 [Helianthus annuus]KAJ0486798.1 hypothetical protein HanHA89_Chr14g0583541 [Helianthus annuus]KAJ0660935.1 hypothetical protein HanOQP8_Chr14g0543151 [Helianthus annuus]KAJ0841447.1 hypothetical protein HanPSC8_Chr14g0630441 [Helianthus annuus]
MDDPDESLSRHRLAEVAGGTTAECAAVVCCFPCTVVHFIVLAVYKLPAGLYRKAVKRKRRRRLLKKGLLIQRPNGEIIAAGHRVTVVDGGGERFVTKSVESDEDFIEFENEMWEKFYGTGFFRSLSQRVN